MSRPHKNPTPIGRRMRPANVVGAIGYPDLKRRIIDVAKTRRYEAGTILIEDTASGASLIQDLRRTAGLYPIAIKPQGDKAMRLWAELAQIESGQVLIPEDAAWLGDFQAEVMQFPHGRHDDQVDSMTQMLKWWRDRNQRVMWVSELQGF